VPKPSLSVAPHAIVCVPSVVALRIVVPSSVFPPSLDVVLSESGDAPSVQASEETPNGSVARAVSCTSALL
jgi:hypothetical protein